MKQQKGHAVRQTGFTLFELLVSISIIGILMAIATVSFSNAQRKGRDARRMEDLKAIQNAAEMYYSASPNYVYPTTKSAWTLNGQNYLANFPVDPKNDATHQYTFSAVGGGVPNGTNYCACATMESGLVNSDDNCNQFGNGTTLYCVRNQQ